MTTNSAIYEDLQTQVQQLSAQVDTLLCEKSLRRDFLAHIAHELRTPLNTIIGFAQILDRHTDLSIEQQEYLQLILLSGEQLLSLINDILQMNKLESGEISLNHSEIDLLRLVEILNSIYGAEAKEKQLNFEVLVAEDLPRYVIGDDSKLRQILSNLLSNAIKFTETGTVSLAIFPEYAYGDPDHLRLIFAVKDTGRGIKDEEMEKVFQPYQQTTSGEDSMRGTGLGLAITREIVDLMDGYIEVDSEWERGSTFTVNIKVKRVHNQHKDIETSPNVVSLDLASKYYRVLIVDDNKSNRMLLQNLLSKVGFDVELAVNGQQAVEIFIGSKPDLILMDMRMPIMNGTDAIKQIRSIAPDDDVIILALTADAFLQADGDDLPSGCDDYIVKPFRISNLLKKIGGHLGLSVICNEDSQHTAIKKNNVLKNELLLLTPQESEHLHTAVSSYSIERVSSIIDELPPNLATFVSDCIEEFDFDAILSLIAMQKK